MSAPLKEIEDDGTELSRWLEDSGHRRAMRLQDSPEALIQYLEKLSGKKLESRDDVLLFYRKLSGEEEARRTDATGRRIRREAIFLGCLVLAIAQYYFADVFLDIGRLHNNHYFIPR